MLTDNGTQASFSAVNGVTSIVATIKVKNDEPFIGELDCFVMISIGGVEMGGGGRLVEFENDTEMEVKVGCGITKLGESSAVITVNDLTLQVDKDGGISVA